MNNKVQKATVAIVAVIVFLATFFGSTREQVVVEAKKIVTDSNNINNDYLIGIQSLENALGAKGLVILDIRSSKEYDEGHIPGAINVSWNQFIDKNKQSISTQSDTKNNSNENNAIDSNNEISNDTTNWTNLINKKVLTDELQNLGITKDSTVVIYGDSNGDDLGQLGKFSWMFRMVGIQSKMLNGGYKNWESQGFKTDKLVPKVEKSNMQVESFVPVKVIKKADLEKNISKIKILELVNDVKQNEENLANTSNSKMNSNGSQSNNSSNTNEAKKSNDTNSKTESTKMNNDNVQLKTNQQDSEIDPPVKGVIQIKLSDMLNPNGTIKPVSKLQQLFSAKGLDKKDIVLFYNTDKGNLSFLTLMLNMAGYNNIETYNASLSQVAQITTKIIQTQKNSEKDSSNQSQNNESKSSVNTSDNKNNNSNNTNANSNSTQSSSDSNGTQTSVKNESNN